MTNYSKNRKLNALLNAIEDSLLTMCDTEEESLNEIRRHMKSYPHERDYRIVQNGNLLCYFSQVYDLYRECGYTSTDRMSTSKIWETYKRQVGYIAREIMKARREHKEARA